jgi:hypothetical protein
MEDDQIETTGPAAPSIAADGRDVTSNRRRKR